jgi:hypothetical protein
MAIAALRSLVAGLYRLVTGRWSLDTLYWTFREIISLTQSDHCGGRGGPPFYEIICQASNFIFWFSRNLQFFVGWFSGGSGTFLSLPSIRVDSLIDHHIQHSPSGLVKPV